MSVIDASTFYSLPYPEARKLVILHWEDGHGRAVGDISANAWQAVRQESKTLKSMAAVYPVEIGMNVAGVEPPQYIKALGVSRGFLETVGVKPFIGRDFVPEEDLPGGSRSSIISYGLWEHSFGKDPSITGRSILINGQSYTIIGVMPRYFRSYPDADMWIPLQLSLANADPGSDYRVIGRIGDGFTSQQVQQELRLLSEQQKLQFLPSGTASRGVLAVEGFQNFLIGKNRKSLLVLFAAVVFVLVIACTNVAVLLLVRAAADSREICLRIALGSSRFRLMQAFLAESLLMALAAGAAGTILAKELIPLAAFFIPPDLSFSRPLSIDLHVLGFALVTTLVSAVLFGFLPALKMSSAGASLIGGLVGRGVTLDIAQTRLVRILVVAETALTVILLSGTFVLVQSFANLHSVPAGFDARHMIVAQVSLAGDRYRQTEATALLVNRAMELLRNHPDIESVATINGLPLEKGLNLPVYPVDSPGKLIHAVEYRVVAGSYFGSMHIPLVAGKDFSGSETPESTAVAIVNEALAARWWPHQPAVGHFLNVGSELGPVFADKPRLIIGVVRDVHDASLSAPAAPTVFVPLPQLPDNLNAFVNKLFFTSILLRTKRDIGFYDILRNALGSGDPGLPLASYRTLTQVINQSLSQSSFVASLSSIFGSFALLLTATGLYALLSYQISSRKKEIAIRIAVGADRFEVTRSIIQKGLMLVSTGVLAGAVGAVFLTSVLRNLLYNVTGSFVSVVSVVGLVCMVAIVASVLAAIQAVSFEPVAALRNE